MNILAVDDTPDLLRLLDAGLSRDGTRLVCCKDGETALKTLKSCEEPFDCILVDIQMPGMDGIELTRRIRKQEAYAETPILMLTAMSQMSYLERAFAAGANDYVTKPFDMPRLRQQIAGARRRVSEVREARDEDPSQLSPRLLSNLRGAQLHVLSRDSGSARILRPVDFDNLMMCCAELNDGETHVVALKFANWTDVCEGLPAAVANRLLVATAAALELEIAESAGFVVYRGSGTFLVIETKRPTEGPGRLHRRAIEAVSAEQISHPVRLVVGARVSTRLFDHGGALLLVQEALASLSDQENRSRPPVALPRRLIRNFLRSTLQKIYEDAAYRETLNAMVFKDKTVVPFGQLVKQRRATEK